MCCLYGLSSQKVSALVYLIHIAGIFSTYRSFENLLPLFVEERRRRRPMMVPPVCVCVCVCARACVCVYVCVRVCRQKFSKVRI